MGQGRGIPARLALAAVVIAALGVADSAKAQGANDGLVGYWAFDEGQGAVAADTSGNDRHGKIRAGQWVTGTFGTALRFDGEDACVVLPPAPDLNGSDAMTISVWVFWEGVGRYPNIVTGGAWNPGGFLIFVADDSCSFRLGKPGDVEWEIGKTWQETRATLLRPIELGTWYHLAATFNRPDITTYVNGEPVGSGSWNLPVGQTGEILVGRWNLDQGSTQSHHGLIDELRFYNRALSASEVKAQHADGRVGRE